MTPEFANREQILAIQKKIREFEYEKRLENEDLIEYEYTIEVECKGKTTGKFYAFDDEDANNKLEEICNDTSAHDIDFDETELEITDSEFDETGKIQLAKNKIINENQLNLFEEEK